MMRKSVCRDCPRRRIGCRSGCVDRAAEEIMAALEDKRDPGRDADGFLSEMSERRRRRWHIQHKGRR